jgi:hypothetical protein
MTSQESHTEKLANIHFISKLYSDSMAGVQQIAAFNGNI